jgi:hypothetical protein
MLVWSLPAKILALTGFFICAQALPGPRASVLSKRMYATGSRSTSSGELSFEDVYNGGFQPALGTRGITRDIPRFYNGMYFYHRAPVLTFYRGQRIPKVDLDVASATFNKFHVYDLVEGRYTTIERDGSDATRAIRSAWHGDIEAYMRPVDDSDDTSPSSSMATQWKQEVTRRSRVSGGQNRLRPGIRSFGPCPLGKILD